MDVNISKDISARPDLEAAIKGASKLLEEELGASAASVKADWNLTRDRDGRLVVELLVSDWTGAVGYRFSPDELSNQAHTRLRLHRLWGDLLQVRSHAQLDAAWWQLQGQAGG